VRGLIRRDAGHTRPARVVSEGDAMTRNTDFERVAALFVGDWTLSITNQWCLEDPTTVTTGGLRLTGSATGKRSP
jgi:hypothetical protein